MLLNSLYNETMYFLILFQLSRKSTSLFARVREDFELRETPGWCYFLLHRIDYYSLINKINRLVCWLIYVT